MDVGNILSLKLVSWIFHIQPRTPTNLNTKPHPFFNVNKQTWFGPPFFVFFSPKNWETEINWNPGLFPSTVSVCVLNTTVHCSWCRLLCGGHRSAEGPHINNRIENNNENNFKNESMFSLSVHSFVFCILCLLFFHSSLCNQSAFCFECLKILENWK